jgi:hypothetical protein
MHDLGYIVAGYSLTALGLIAYRWRLAARTRKATALIRAASGRRTAAGGRTG